MLLHTPRCSGFPSLNMMEGVQILPSNWRDLYTWQALIMAGSTIINVERTIINGSPGIRIPTVT